MGAEIERVELIPLAQGVGLCMAIRPRLIALHASVKVLYKVGFAARNVRLEEARRSR
jgi:hypothetical protein